MKGLAFVRHVFVMKRTGGSVPHTPRDVSLEEVGLCMCVCASVHVSVCMSELCGVCHPCILSWCVLTQGTSIQKDRTSFVGIIKCCYG